jgi:hypothetical protein
MKRTLIAGFVALALTGASFGQGAPPASPNKGKDDTNFQKGNPDPTDPAKQPKQDKKGKGKNGKDKDGKGKDGKGTPPTVPNPDPTPNPNPAAPPPNR